ncbi:hypothetical protein GCM10011335_53360 [Aureimonas glaciei]|uniref:Cellulose biosynthesis protein BcsN n=1 Tax=Aureimonas glaciei TaxID=1776957 RepID=A0A916YGA4_9HYPH|nr:hypothetical protein GCM10011335_53360 [Aureimonas glaciei]
MRLPVRAGFLGLAALAASAFLSACGVTGQPQLSSPRQSVELEEAFALPPPGGPALVAVVEQRYPNATEQKILLQGDGRSVGQNYLLVRFFGPVGSDVPYRTALSDRPIASTNMSAEMRKALPGIAMGRSPLFVQNRYGPFGYAVGTAPSGDTCLYAWQRISDIASAPRLFSPKGSIQIRLRLCSASAGAEELLMVMYGFTIKAAFGDAGWNPYGSPDGPDASLGKAGAPIYPSDPRDLDPEVVFEPAPPPAAPASRPARRPKPPAAAVVTPAPPLPAPIGPAIPAPPTGLSSDAGTGDAPAGAAGPDTAATTVPSPPTCATGEPTRTPC